MTASSVVSGTENAGRGNKRGTATVSVVDNLGGAVQGATVTVRFESPYNETRSGTTNSSGVVTISTNGTAKGGAASSFVVCVTNLTHPTLTWDGIGTCNTSAIARGDVARGVSADGLPTDYALAQNFPNPFRETTLVEYGMPEAGHVTLTVVDVTGQTIATLVDEYRDAGFHRDPFNAERLSPGLYIALLKVNGVTRVRRMTLLN